MERDSKFELLRILAMMMIILNHYEQYGGINFKYSRVFAPLGQVGVGIFVMISAYFLTSENNSKQKIFNRILSLWCHVIFYSWIILIVDLFIKFSSINIQLLIKSIFPVMANNYWFVTSFFFLMLITPFLNKIIRNVNKIQLILILIILIVFSSITTIIGQPYTPFGERLNVGVMISDYIFIGYYRKYGIKLGDFTLILVALVFYIAEYFTITSGFPSIVLSATLFILVVQIMPSYHSYCINWIASSVFASYLITENVLFRKIFWQILTSLFTFHNKFLEGFVITIIAIIITVLIDKIYLLIFNNLIRKKLNVFAEALTDKVILEKRFS